MEIILKRIAKKNTYTIGRLFIVKSEEGRVKNSCAKGTDSKPRNPPRQTLGRQANHPL